MGDDEVFGLQDSDFNGGKGDSEGYKINAAYTIVKNTEAGISYLLWKNDISSATAMIKDLVGITNIKKPSCKGIIANIMRKCMKIEEFDARICADHR